MVSKNQRKPFSLACHPVLSTKWLGWVAKWCEWWRMHTVPCGSVKYFLFNDDQSRCIMKGMGTYINRPFAQLLPGLETGHPVTVGQSPAYDCSVSDEQKAVFLASISDCSVCDSCAGDWPTVTGCPVSNPGNNCANGLFRVNFMLVLLACLQSVCKSSSDNRSWCTCWVNCFLAGTNKF